MTKRNGSVSALPRSDEQLFVAMQAGDVEALGYLYDRYRDQAFRIACCIAHNMHDAEEAVQDAFISIWTSRNGYRSQAETAAPWVLTVVRHRAIDLVQRRSRYRARVTSDSTTREEPSDDGIEDDAEDREQALEMRLLLKDIPDKQREVITLAFFGELTHNEIAEQLVLPLGTVKGRMRLGLTKLSETIPARTGSN